MSDLEFDTIKANATQVVAYLAKANWSTIDVLATLGVVIAHIAVCGKFDEETLPFFEGYLQSILTTIENDLKDRQ